MPLSAPTRAFTTWTLFATATAVLALVCYLWSRQVNTLSHLEARQLILHYMISRADDPVIVLGDSLTEASTLPRSVCGRPLLNAGINGAAVTDDLGPWLAAALDGKRPAAIIVALGTNDALTPRSRSVEAFADRYVGLLAELALLSPRLAILGIPPVQVEKRLTAEMEVPLQRSIDAHNAMLPGVAARSGVTLVPILDFPKQGTIDGIHLNGAGYAAWDKAVLQAAEGLCR